MRNFEFHANSVADLFSRWRNYGADGIDYTYYTEDHGAAMFRYLGVSDHQQIMVVDHRDKDAKEIYDLLHITRHLIGGVAVENGGILGYRAYSLVGVQRVPIFAILMGDKWKYFWKSGSLDLALSIAA